MKKIPRKYIKRLVIASILVATSAFSVPVLQEKAAELSPGYYKVVHVADGDTINVLIDGKQEKVRFIGVDTPEKNDSRKPVQCYAKAASNFTAEKLDGGSVRLEADAQSDNRDRYGRLLRYVYLHDGTLINKEIIAQGYGFAMTSFPHSKMSDFTFAQSQAEKEHKGLWNQCTVDKSRGYPQTQAAQ